VCVGQFYLSRRCQGLGAFNKSHLLMQWGLHAKAVLSHKFTYLPMYSVHSQHPFAQFPYAKCPPAIRAEEMF
jgi:hypothetical protein